MMLAFALMTIPAPLPAYQLPLEAAATKCDIGDATDMGKLTQVLSARVVDIFRRARNSAWRGDPILKRLVDDRAIFDLGAGDVGRPMGKGTSGAHAMATEMKANAFRYSVWTYIPTPADPCAAHEVSVTFVGAESGDTAEVKASFRNGILLSAKGWMGVEVTGKL